MTEEDNSGPRAGSTEAPRNARPGLGGTKQKKYSAVAPQNEVPVLEKMGDKAPRLTNLVKFERPGRAPIWRLDVDGVSVRLTTRQLLSPSLFNASCFRQTFRCVIPRMRKEEWFKVVRLLLTTLTVVKS